jgi:uncharacterized membrane protein
VDRRTLIFVLVVVAVLASAAGAVVYGRRTKPGTEATYCAEVRAGENPQAILLRAGDEAQPEDSVAVLRQGADRLRSLQKAAPKDIRSKLGTLAQTADTLADGMVDPDSTADLDDPSKEVNAGEVVLAYTLQHCEVDWSVPTASDGPALPPASPPPG